LDNAPIITMVYPVHVTRSQQITEKTSTAAQVVPVSKQQKKLSEPALKQIVLNFKPKTVTR
jgi:hypothetical protein